MEQQTKHSARTYRRRGFTLLEMLVVGSLGTLMMLFMANASRWYSRSVQATQIATQLTRELKFAADTIAQDYGSALAARSTDGTKLEFDFDGGAVDGIAQWISPDVVVEYRIDGNQLMRRNMDSGDELPLANHITEISAATVGGKLQVLLTAKLRKTEQSLTLQLEGP